MTCCIAPSRSHRHHHVTVVRVFPWSEIGGALLVLQCKFHLPAPNDAEEIPQEFAIEADSKRPSGVARLDRFRGFAHLAACCR